MTAILTSPQWHAYNLIQEGDRLRAKAMRRIVKPSETGASSSIRIAIDLTILVTSTDFDTAGGTLHVSGKVASENEHVKMGQHHTLDLELNRKFTLEKADGWDSSGARSYGPLSWMRVPRISA
jgi:protein pelota